MTVFLRAVCLIFEYKVWITNIILDVRCLDVFTSIPKRVRPTSIPTVKMLLSGKEYILCFFFDLV